MTQFDEFNARVERTVSQADREVERDTKRRGWLGFETSSFKDFLTEFILFMGTGLVWTICLVLGAIVFVAIAFDVSFKVAMMILFLAVVAIAMVGMAGSD